MKSTHSFPASLELWSTDDNSSEALSINAANAGIFHPEAHMLPMTLENLKRVTLISVREVDGALSMSVDQEAGEDSRINVGVMQNDSGDDRRLGFDGPQQIGFVVDLMEAVTGSRFVRRFEDVPEGYRQYKRQ